MSGEPDGVTPGSAVGATRAPRGRRGLAAAAKDLLRPTVPYRLALRLRDRLERRGRFDRFFLDMTSSCNLRCPFCINDWSIQGEPHFMTEDDFRLAIQLLPLVVRDNSHLSCSYEPTLHKDLISFLELVPRKHARQAFFTTNLTTKISDDFVRRLAVSGLGRVQISIESLQPERYELMRKNARFTRFIDNLERLTAAFASTPGAPRVRFITVASKLNLDEIPSLVRQCNERFGAFEHQIRPFYRVAANAAWLDRYELEPGDWQRLEQGLRGCTCRYSLHEPTAEGPEELELRYVAIGAEGLAEVGWCSDRRFAAVGRYKLSEIQRPLEFFGGLLKQKSLVLPPPNTDAVAPPSAEAGAASLPTVWSAGVTEPSAGGTRISQTS